MKKASMFRNRTVLYCFASTIMMVIGIASVTPILPTLTRVFNVPPSQASWIIISFAVPGLLTTPLSGIIADRFGSKRVLVPSLMLFAVGGVICAVANNFLLLLAGRFVQGMGSGAMGVLALTVLSDCFEDSVQRITALGYNNSLMSIASAIIPLAAGSLAGISWRLPLLLSAFALPLAFLIWFDMRTPAYSSNAPVETLGEYLKAVGRAISQREVMSVLVITVVNFAILFGPLVTFFPELADKAFHAAPAQIGLIMSASSVGTLLVAAQIGRILGRITACQALLLSFVLFATALLVLPFVPGMYWCILPIFLLGIGQGITSPTLLSCLLAAAPYEQRSGVLAVNGTLVRLAQAIGPLIFGLIYSGVSLHAVFIFGGVASLLSCITVKRGLCRKSGPA